MKMKWVVFFDMILLRVKGTVPDFGAGVSITITGFLHRNMPIHTSTDIHTYMLRMHM
jgi:hypothetical protein